MELSFIFKDKPMLTGKIERELSGQVGTLHLGQHNLVGTFALQGIAHFHTDFGARNELGRRAVNGGDRRTIGNKQQALANRSHEFAGEACGTIRQAMRLDQR